MGMELGMDMELGMGMEVGMGMDIRIGVFGASDISGAGTTMINARLAHSHCVSDD
jgi:hypothetical protein